MLGEWSERLQAFWCGVNGCEHIAHKGSYEIGIYHGDESPPSQFLVHHKRIETIEDFDECMNDGAKWNATYERV